MASELDVGSTFAFFIKTRHAPNPTLPPIINTDLSAQQDKSDQTKQREKSDINILVVEDNILNQKVLRQQLSKLGYSVVVADNGLECLSYLQSTRHWRGASTTSQTIPSNHISLILMDIEMPLMDGLTATSRIRMWEKEGKISTHIPIIAVSANARQEQRETALQAGMDDCVAKPFRVKELVVRIEGLVGWR